MQQAVLQFFQQHPNLAVAASLAISIVVAVAGVIPSFFVTAANILFFGFWQGVGLSFLGEALGAAVAFWAYRKGFKKGVAEKLGRFPTVQRLVSAESGKAFGLILSLRLIPFVPSGLVTFAAAIGKVTALTFLIASSVGKLPALLLEGYAVYQVTEAGWQAKVFLAAAGGLALAFVWQRLRKGDKSMPN